MMLAFCIFTAHKKSDLYEVSDEWGDEHVVQSVVLVVQNVLETSAAAEGHQDADVARLDARAQERDQVVVTKFTHLVNKGAFTSLEPSLIPFDRYGAMAARGRNENGFFPRMEYFFDWYKKQRTVLGQVQPPNGLSGTRFKCMEPQFTFPLQSNYGNWTLTGKGKV